MNVPQRIINPSPGNWINERLLSTESNWAQVGSVVPTGFPRVVRVLHPADDGRSSWADVAAASGRTVHPLVQWDSIAQDFDGNGRSEYDPSEGSIPEETLSEILRHCPADGDVMHAVWIGWGSWNELPDESTLMPGWGGRDYVLFRASKEPHMSWPGMNPFSRQSASLIWPSDCNWCIATEIDWDSTLVAGSDLLIEALLKDRDLEVFEVGYHDDLSQAGDVVNPRPPWVR